MISENTILFMRQNNGDVLSQRDAPLLGLEVLFHCAGSP